MIEFEFKTDIFDKILKLRNQSYMETLVFEIVLGVRKGIETKEVVESLIYNFVKNVGNTNVSHGSAQIRVLGISKVEKRKRKAKNKNNVGDKKIK